MKLHAGYFMSQDSKNVINPVGKMCCSVTAAPKEWKRNIQENRTTQKHRPTSLRVDMTSKPRRLEKSLEETNVI